jgi:hypothetical protein
MAVKKAKSRVKPAAAPPAQTPGGKKPAFPGAAVPFGKKPGGKKPSKSGSK